MKMFIHIVFFIGLFGNSDACDITSRGINTFGPECQYMCHCVNGAACDVNTGECTNRCVDPWYGPGCQFRDLAYDEKIKHSSNIRPKQGAKRAIDGDTITCSHTSKQTNPWWKVWLPRNETIQELSILTNDASKSNFASFTVTVEYVPEANRTLDWYLPGYSEICHQTINKTSESTNIHVGCRQPLRGNQVRIQLNNTNVQLVLCDVRINGGRNFAFGSNATGITTQDDVNHVANNAVDGSLTTNFDTCFVSAYVKHSWLSVDLGREVYVTFANIIKYSNERLIGYLIEVSNNNITWGEVYNDASNAPPTTQVSLNVTTRYIRIKRAGTRIIICELQLFGNCPSNKCGYGCTDECHCKGIETLENRINGICTSGCNGRWTGIDGTCNTECLNNKWGDTCTNECGACSDSKCDVTTGKCADGCQIGYYETDMCNKECDNDTWHNNCTRICGNCYEDQCNRTNGSCFSSCASGYKDMPYCLKVCAAGTWGMNCNRTCGSCMLGVCNALSGICESGCATGYKHTSLCNEECDNDTWGMNCSTKCGSCLSGTCNTADGSCQSGCASGYKNTTLCTEACQNQTWGINCNSTCGYCLNDTCNASNGVCTSGCMSGYKNTTHCKDVCDAGSWGLRCNRTCGRCMTGICDASNGSCFSGCAIGYKPIPLCSEECDNGTWGLNCNMTCGSCLSGTCNISDGFCQSGCASGYENTTLCTDECENGTWGYICNNTCGNCLNGTCHKSDGTCDNGCMDGYRNTPLCIEECANGTWGEGCNGSCGSCNESTCNKTDGTCGDGCSSGYLDTPLCTKECENGQWGYNCTDICGNCLSGPCDKSDGTCEYGCMDGYEDTPFCNKACQSGYYGENCNETCNVNCGDKLCYHVNGSCTNGCTAGWKGELCDQDCADGTYGMECKNECNTNCHETCDKVNGHCTKCNAGWNGTLCDTECDNGTFGDECAFDCGKCNGGAACHKVNGSCTVGCAAGYEGSMCSIQTEHLVSGFPGAAVGGSVSAIIVIAIVAVGVVFVLRRKHLSSQSKGSTSSSEDMGLKDVCSAGKETGDTLRIKKTDSQNNIYYEFGEDATEGNQPRAIHVKELAAFVKTHVAKKEFFDKEFQDIPYGLQFPTTEARKEHNAGKNRYKAMYAYDHTRVILSTLPSNPHSDYINANYIKGYHKEKAYIATQGPSEVNVNDFWRMVWEEDVQIIAMVTNLVENTKLKCIQYWEPVDNSKKYGDITLYTESEEIFAEFSIRRFKLSKQGETSSRIVVQYAYTAWPDKDVPASTCSLLHFWNKVRKNDENKTHPWLVHCSAGVGRTGTFIALDFLYDQGTDVGYVDINMCVRNLREQRVNMVQKEAQFAYLYRIMVEALVLPSSPVALNEFDPWYTEQLDFDKKSGKTKLMLEFEGMDDDSVFVTNTDHKETEDNDCVYANTQVDENKSKNRYSNILAADEFRPFLSTYVPGTNNYINAVYMPSYNDLRGYLMTQTPLPDTAVDCCRLILEQEIHVIVTFDDDGDNVVGVYLTPGGSIEVGPFTVTLTSTEEDDGYLIRKYCIVYKSKEHALIQYIYKKWSTYTLVPEEPNHVLDFLHKVDEQDRQFDSKPTLMQCINGAERSGLFVVLMNVIERARIDEEVSIPQVIRYLRTRRQQIVPNYDQYKFCHDVMLCYAESNSTYANM